MEILVLIPEGEGDGPGTSARAYSLTVVYVIGPQKDRCRGNCSLLS